jgi:colanic acid biosynthesis glycosyl transferase WcaI
LKDKVQKLGLYNVFFLPRVSAAKVGTYLAAADVLLIHLRDDPLFSLNIPSKLQAYMLAGKPIIMGAKGEAKRLLDDAVAGVSVPPGNPRKLAEAVLCLAAMPKHLRDKLGDNARNYYWRKLCMEKGMKIFFSIFKNVRSS